MWFSFPFSRKLLTLERMGRHPREAGGKPHTEKTYLVREAAGSGGAVSQQREPSAAQF